MSDQECKRFDNGFLVVDVDDEAFKLILSNSQALINVRGS